MRLIERIRNEAREVALKRGHTMDRFTPSAFRNEAGAVVHVLKAICTGCKMNVVCVDLPMSGENQIGGDAYEKNCTVGSAQEDTPLKLLMQEKRRQLKKLKIKDKERFDKLNEKLKLKS